MCSAYKVYVQDLEHWVTGKSRYRSWNIVGGDERHDGNHGKTSIVEFSALLGLQCFSRDLGHIDRRENDGRHGSSLHVVGALGFSGEFGNEDSSQDLCLSGVRNGIPSIEWLHGRKGFEGNITAEHTREVESGGLDDVSCGGKHGNAAVLQFGGAEPGQSLVTSDGGKAKWVKALDRSGSSRQIGKGIELGASSLQKRAASQT